MKKYLFLFVGLLAFAANGPTEAKVFKLGRGSLKQTNGSSNLIVNGGSSSIIVPASNCSMESCRKDGDCIKFSDFACSGVKTTDGEGNCLCKLCSSGQYVYNNQCIPFCSGVTCNTGYTPVAQSDQCCCESVCREGYVWHTVIGRCVTQKCVANCANCSPDYYCLRCNEGHYLNYTDGTCPACSSVVENCSKCTQSGSKVTCTACESGYTLKFGQCIADTQNCLEGYVWNPVIGRCVVQKCDIHCDCSLDNYCLECASGYYLSYTDGSCPTCSSAISHCSECSSSAFGGVTCTACESGYALSDGVCVASTPICPSGKVYHPVLERCVSSMCISNCASPYSTCDKQLQLGYCPQCATGYYMEYSNGGCSVCSSAITGCRQCTSSCSVCSDGRCTQCAAGNGDENDGGDYRTLVTCTVCENGYNLRGGQCISSCPSGQVYHPTLNTCVTYQCPANCADADCGTKGYCTTCIRGYTLDGRGLCVSSGGGLGSGGLGDGGSLGDLGK